MSKLTVGNVREILENNQIYSQGGNSEQGYEEFGYTSPCGEDFIFTLHYEDNAETLSQALTEYAENFDPEEHAVSWYNHQNDTTGVPESLKDLLEDAEDIKDVLIQAAKEVDAAIEGKAKTPVFPHSSRELDDLVDHLVNFFVSDDYNYEVIRDDLDYVAVDNSKENEMCMEVIFCGKKFKISAEEVAS